MLLYVDDFIAIYETPKEAVLQLYKFFKMKPNSIAPPDIYLGGKLKKINHIRKAHLLYFAYQVNIRRNNRAWLNLEEFI